GLAAGYYRRLSRKRPLPAQGYQPRSLPSAVPFRLAPSSDLTPAVTASAFDPESTSFAFTAATPGRTGGNPRALVMVSSSFAAAVSRACFFFQYSRDSAVCNLPVEPTCRNVYGAGDWAIAAPVDASKTAVVARVFNTTSPMLIGDGLPPVVSPS